MLELLRRLLRVCYLAPQLAAGLFWGSETGRKNTHHIIEQATGDLLAHSDLQSLGSNSLVESILEGNKQREHTEDETNDTLAVFAGKSTTTVVPSEDDEASLLSS